MDRLKPSAKSSLPNEMRPDEPPKEEKRLINGLHFRGKLPHLKREGAVYFVTFRLNDSLPASEILRLKREWEAILQQS